MSSREEDLKPCIRCGLRRRVYRGLRRKPAEYCRACTPNYRLAAQAKRQVNP